MISNVQFSTEIEQQLNLSILDIKNYGKTAIQNYMKGLFETAPDVEFILAVLRPDNGYIEFTFIMSEFETVVKQGFADVKRRHIRKSANNNIQIECQDPFTKKPIKLWITEYQLECFAGVIPFPIFTILGSLEVTEVLPHKRVVFKDDGMDIFKQRQSELFYLFGFLYKTAPILFHRSGKQYAGFAFSVIEKE
ncbi:MAG TPA: hypothetical protein PLP33_07490 [Leptospiraceae bacterium]|nr:hypothetical protein [Leptospiraceae bacterium]